MDERMKPWLGLTREPDQTERRATYATYRWSNPWKQFEINIFNDGRVMLPDSTVSADVARERFADVTYLMKNGFPFPTYPPNAGFDGTDAFNAANVMTKRLALLTDVKDDDDVMIHEGRISDGSDATSSDSEREATIRTSGHPEPVAFLLRLLDEARARADHLDVERRYAQADAAFWRKSLYDEIDDLEPEPTSHDWTRFTHAPRAPEV